MIKRYNKGRRFEWKTRDILKGLNYYVVRSAGSKSKIDLVAFLKCSKDNLERLPIIRVIQVKTDSSPIKKDKLALKRLKLPTIVCKEIWHWQKGEKEPKIIEIDSGGAL